MLIHSHPASTSVWYLRLSQSCRDVNITFAYAILNERRLRGVVSNPTFGDTAETVIRIATGISNQTRSRAPRPRLRKSSKRRLNTRLRFLESSLTTHPSNHQKLQILNVDQFRVQNGKVEARTTENFKVQKHFQRFEKFNDLWRAEFQ